MRPRLLLIIVVSLGFSALQSATYAVEISGELRQWHDVILTFDGPTTSELATPNPFTDYRLTVIFTNGVETLQVPGYFAADGNAAESGSTSGNKWRAHFAPPTTGIWNYAASFRQDTNIAVQEDPNAGVSVSFDGESGSFEILPTATSGRDLRGKGRLEYVGERYLRFAGSGQYFLKGGADSPENFLAYGEFDQTTPSHFYAPHITDWEIGDPTWRGTMGRGIIGALNYLSGRGMNSVYFLTMNVNGDGDDVWPWIDRNERIRFDCSKLDQWEIVFDHMDCVGIMLHVVTQETENDHLLDSGELGLQRKLYYRELIARFAHHNAVAWNLGEENTNTEAQRIQYSQFFDNNDPYDHPVVVHTFPSQQENVYAPLLGHPGFEGPSLQTGGNNVVRDWIDRSVDADRPWIVCYDEQSPAFEGVVPDSVDPTHNQIRKDVLWGTLIAGGAGVEYYFGYGFPHHDLNCEDWRSRENMWDQTRFALEFFEDYLPFWQMYHANELVLPGGIRCLADPESTYAIFVNDGSRTTDLDVGMANASFRIRWFNPREGGELQWGTRRVTGGIGFRPIGRAPNEDDQDWLALVERCELGCIGDVDGNGIVDGLDITPFLDCLLANQSSGACELADADGDQSISEIDIAYFVESLLDNSAP